MHRPSPSVPQVARLTPSQIAQFKREGFVVLPNVIDPELCRRARDQMWDTIADHWPTMKRDDPSTWVPFPAEDWRKSATPAFKWLEGGGEPYFQGKGHKFFIRNGAEDLLIDIGGRSVWNIAEQLLGKGEVVWPVGLDESNCTTGPSFLTEKEPKWVASHMGPGGKNWTGSQWSGRAQTEQVMLPKTGPHWITAQGTRGMYCTLPDSPPSGGPDWPGSHAGEGLYDSRMLLQTAVYFDDLPPASGGLTLWPRSHTRIWDHWEPINRNGSATGTGEGAPRFVGYAAPPLGDIRVDTAPVVTHGPVGSVVLWHSIMLHMAGVNTSNDVIRQATLYGFHKTAESVPDERVSAGPTGGIWDSWSDEVRGVPG